MVKLGRKIFNILKDINPFSNRKVDNKMLYIIKILLTTAILYFGSLIVAEVLIIGGSSFWGYNATDNQLPQDIMLICSFFGYIVTIITFIVYIKKICKNKTATIGLDKNFKSIFKGILIGILSLTVVILILILCGAIKFNGINNNINWVFFILFLFAYLIQSAMEEIVCRGFILHRLKEKIPTFYAIVISMAFFTIGHFSKLFEEGMILGIIGLINLILISIIYTLLTLKDKNIYSAIGLHYIWNIALFSIIGLNLSGIDASNSLLKMTPVNSFLTGSSYGIESSIITTIILALVVIILNYNRKSKEINCFDTRKK